MEYYIGIDIGSTNIKALACDAHARQAAYASRPTPMLHSRPDFSEYDMESVWGNALECLHDIASQLPKGSVAAIGVSSLGETNVLTDGEGQPLHPAIAWFDQRALEECDRLNGIIAEQSLYAHTGQFTSPKFGLCKLLWMCSHHPGLLEKARHFLSVEDYILFHLTGNAVTDYSIASRSLCFDIQTKEWLHELLGELSIPVRLFPRAVPGGERVGRLRREVAQTCGLTEGISVCTGGHDHACACVAVGAHTGRFLLDSMGTSEVTISAVKKPLDAEAGFRNGICCYPHFGILPYRAMSSMQACGASVEWFLKTYGQPDGSGNVYTLLIEEAMSSDERNAPIFISALRGAQENPGACAAFAGIKDVHGRADMARALFEGLCFILRRKIETFEKATGLRYASVKAVGGLAQSDRFLALKADILQRPVEIPAITEAAALGAALLAGAAEGGVDLDDASLYRTEREVEPKAIEASFYAGRYQKYLEYAKAVEAVE